MRNAFGYKLTAFKLIICLFLISFTFLYPVPLTLNPSSAQSIEDLDKALQDKQQKIKEAEAQLDQTRTQKKNLQSQLSYIDAQNNLTQLKIDQTKFQITKLTKEITDLDGRVERLSGAVNTLSALLLDRIVRTYKYSSVSTIDMLFSSNGFSDLLERIKYLNVVQAHDKKVLYQLQATKTTYNDQKQDKQTRQSEQIALQKDLEKYEEQLIQQKKAKEDLLKITQNDENKYQSLISQLQAEIASINQAISNVGPKIGDVGKGDVIAHMGSTGCSTGPHLHFETFENAHVEGGKVIGSRVNPHNYLDNGKLGPPLQGYPGETQITTEYGEIYFLGTHTGLDIAPKAYEGLGRPVLAAEKGVAYGTSALCPYHINGGSSVGKGVIIDHQNGVVTLYWHIL